MLFDVIAITLTATHFGIPLLYYWYLKSKWYIKPWNVKTDPNYRPKVTIIVPTYREVKHIEKKLDNLRQQDYPRDKIEVIVIDSASDDGTPEAVKKWAERNPDIKLVLLEEPVRLGMVQALNHALKHVSKDSEVVIFTDEMNKRIDATNERIDAVFQQLSAQIAELNKRIDETNKRIDALQSRIDETNKRIDELQSRIDDLNKVILELQKVMVENQKILLEIHKTLLDAVRQRQ